MKHGDQEFHQLTSPIIDALATEGLRIARDNGWHGLVIEITAARHPLDGRFGAVRCCLRNTGPDPEIDEPTAALLDHANLLQEAFSRAGTPLAGATIDWIDEKNDGSLCRRCRYRYE